MANVFLCLIAFVLLYEPHTATPKHESNASAQRSSAYTPDKKKESTDDTEGAKRGSPHWYASSEWWLVIIAGATGIAIGVQAQLMRRSELLGLRPRLVIRGIDLVDRGDHGWFVDCRIANTGGSVATIIGSNLTFWPPRGTHDTLLPTFPPYDGFDNWVGKRAIMPAQFEQISVPLELPTAFKVSFLRAARELGHNVACDLHCFGFIQYRDQLRVQRRTAFCMHYDINARCFTRVEDEPNYDYED